MQISNQMKENIKNHFGYNDRELSLFLENPKNQELLSKSLKFLGKTIIAEVIESHGCNSQHKVGDKFYFDASGNLLTRLGPEKICIHALCTLEMYVFALGELLSAGVAPEKIRFNRTHCTDVGIECGGWGKCILEIKMVDRNTLKTEKST